VTMRQVRATVVAVEKV